MSMIPTKITREHIQDLIDTATVDYTRLMHNDEQTNITICTIKLHDGYIAMGKSACVCDCNFDLEKGKAAAYEDAVNDIWQSEGRLLYSRLYDHGYDPKTFAGE